MLAHVDQIKTLARAMFDQGEEKVYVAVCCNRLFVGVMPPKGCRTCKKTLDVQELTSRKQLEEFADRAAATA